MVKFCKNMIIFIIMLIFSSAFIYINKTYAVSIGLDETGILGFDDNLNPINNEWHTLDLDFNGIYERYYFNKDGYLQTNKTMGNYMVNDKGQQILGQEVYEVYDPMENPNTTQIDNFDYYYIDKSKIMYNDTLDIDDENRVKISISIPLIKGVDNTMVSKVNDILKNRGLELLKIFTKEEVYKLSAKRFIINIDKYDKYNLHPLNFMKFDNNFYFNFNVYITEENDTDKKKKKSTKDYVRQIGLLVNLNDNSCNILNRTYKELNSMNYENEDYIKEDDISKDDRYDIRYIDVINELKEYYKDSLIAYLDESEIKISEYEDNEDVTNEDTIRYIQKYINNISDVYNEYEKKAKNLKKNNEINEETYKRLLIDLSDMLDTYKNILDRNLQVNIYALKENVNIENY